MGLYYLSATFAKLAAAVSERQEVLQCCPVEVGEDLKCLVALMGLTIQLQLVVFLSRLLT